MLRTLARIRRMCTVPDAIGEGAYREAVDALTQFLDGPRARGAFLLQVCMRPPWSISVMDEAPLTLLPILSGRAWFRPVGAPPQQVGPGDVALARAPGNYVISSDPELAPTVTIGPDQTCSGRDGRDLSTELASDVRTWGNDPEGPDRLLVGTYRTHGEVGRLLLRDLPTHTVVRDAAPQVVSLLADEMRSDHAGQAVVLDRLLDLLLVSTLRKHYERQPVASADPVVSQAIRLLHTDAAVQWTIADLARYVGVSRAVLARRFVAQTGLPPMAYRTRWRLALAADLLRDPDLTVGAVARQVGYGTPYSFSAAFKKQYGISPQSYRDRGQVSEVPGEG